MIHNNKVYANADEKFVTATIVYAKGIGLYHDEAGEKPLTTPEAKELFLHGGIVVIDNNICARIITIKDNDALYASTESDGVTSYRLTAPTE